MQDETLKQLLKAHDEGIARLERQRIACRQQDADECPPGYPEAACVKSAYECKRCWLDWLEADE